MKKAIRAAALALSLCLLLSGCAGRQDNSHNGVVVTTSLEGKPVLVGGIPCEFPLTDEPAELDILACTAMNIHHDDIYIWDKYEQMTGVAVNWTNTKRDDRAEAVYNALVNKQKLDLILRCKISANRLTQYGESGYILDLAKDDLLKNNAPNCWAYLQSHHDALASVTDPNGAIYSLPQVNSGAELRVGVKLFVNKNWLENVGMELPTTTEELYELLKAFKEQDANGNGDPDDEIPFSAIWSSVFDTLCGAFGLENRGMHNQVVDCDESTGGVRYIQSSDGYREFLEYVSRLYSEKLLDEHVFTMTDEQWKNNINNDHVGVFGSTNLAWIPADKLDNWIAIEEALEGPNGDKLWAPIRANFHSTGAAVIPATCEDPALVLRWLDYFWTDEGTLFYHMGVEGETFVVNEDGSYDYAPAIYAEMKTENKNFDEVVAQYTPYPGGSNPTVEVAPYFMGGEMADVPARAARGLFEYGPKEYWPSFTFTAEENDELQALSTDIGKYCEAKRVDFITGAAPLSQWEEYKQQLDSLGLPKLLKIYQSALDRYNALNIKLN